MSKTRAYGADAVLTAVKESTPGTAPDGSGGGVYGSFPFLSFGIGAEKPLGYEPELNAGSGSRDDGDPYYEAVSDQGDLRVAMGVEQIGFWLTHILGAPSTSGAGPYTHVFTSGGEIDPLTFLMGLEAFATPERIKHTYAKLGGFGFDLARSGLTAITIPVIAQGEADGSAEWDPTPTTMAATRFMQGNGVLKVGGSILGNVLSGRMDFSNNLEAVETIRADGLIDGVDETNGSGEGSIRVRHSTDTTLKTAIDAETPVDLIMEYTRPSVSDKITWRMPRIFLPKVKNVIEGPGGIDVDYSFRAAYDATATCLCEVTLINDVATYA